MPALPAESDLTGPTRTNAQMRATHATLRQYLAGLLGDTGDPPEALAALGVTAAAGHVTRSGATTLTAADRGRVVSATSGTWTLTLPSAAAAGVGWTALIANTGTGVITIARDGADLIDGATSATLPAGAAVLVMGTGAAWLTIVLAAGSAAGRVLRSADQTTDPRDATAGRVLRVGASPLQLSASPALRVTVGGTANARTLTSGVGFASIPTGLSLRFRAPGANTGAATINLDGLGAQPCVTITGAALPGGYIRTDTDTLAIWDGTNWVLGREIEAGSNANGRFLRLADGSQNAWATGLNWGDSAAVGTGTTADPYRTVVSAWTFPASFGAAPVVTGMVRGDSNGVNRHHALSIRYTTGVGISQAQAVRLTTVATALTPAIDLVATGHWY